MRQYRPLYWLLKPLVCSCWFVLVTTLTGCLFRASTTTPISAEMAPLLPTSSEFEATTPKILTPAARFQSLRLQQGQFDGGSWNPTIDQWMGTKHQLMLELERAIVAEQIAVAELEGLMGEPDAIPKPTSTQFTEIEMLLTNGRQSAGDSVYWVYNWRGDHDYLIFVIRDQMVVASNWWHAGE